MAEDIFEQSNNIENLLLPFCYVPEVPLPKTTPEVPGGIYQNGFISQDCTWGCCFNQSVIKCFPVDKFFDDNQTGSRGHPPVAISSSSYTFIGGRITCATELAIHNQRTSFGTRKLLLGLSFTAVEKTNNTPREFQGAVVIFDPMRCAPIKWIEVSDPVSSITVLSHFEEGGSNRPFFNETMMTMVGIAAVGLRGGSVYIVDLGLDDPNLASACTPDKWKNSDLTYRLLFVNPHEYVIATKRHKAVSKRSLISLKFTNEPECDMVSDSFHYCRPNGESILMLHKNAVAVSAIEYVPAIGSLLVGYTCGAFQIWRVNNMELQFSSDPIHLDANLPVFGFSFQQPVDDPKNYCYTWVMYGNNSQECSHTLLELHSLYYESKRQEDNFGYAYEGFKQCVRRLALPLVDDFLPCDNDDSSIRMSARPIRIWTQPDGELMFCAWEVGRGGVFYVGVFDLNQWYSNHTREGINYDVVSGLCPYWVAFPVEIPDVTNVLMDTRIIPQSLTRWENPHAKLDMHLYPASISFRALCLTNNGLSAFEHFGVQEKLIRKMLLEGPTLMIQPLEIKRLFKTYGLEPSYHHVYSTALSQKDRDRYYLFSVLLENRRSFAISRLAAVWIDGSYANVGCTVDLIIDWVASYLIALRSSADEHWESLLLLADHTLPPETVRFINFSNFAWTALHRMLLKLMNPTEIFSARGQELENMEYGLGKLVQYSAVLLMLYNIKLLPEKREEGLLSYFNNFYQVRRADARKALETSIYIDKQYKTSRPLMIDHLMDGLQAEEESIRQEWNLDPDQELYPPQHVGYLANMFMKPDVDPKVISRIFMYFLFDLSSFLSEHANISSSSNSETERLIRGDFKAVLDTAGDEYQEVLALWLLDHGYHDEILVYLKENNKLFETDGLPWCAATVALAAAGYEDDVADVLMKSCPPSLAKLLFNLMTSSATRYGALTDLMISTNLGSNDQLLHQFFEISETRECLGKFISSKSMILPMEVRHALLAFLNNSTSVRRMLLLLMYYVHTRDHDKLAEEFSRIKQILRQKNLVGAELRRWRFQEGYISHLLNSKKGGTVERFLRIQRPQSVRQIQSTINIKAVPAEVPSPVEGRLRYEDKLPPQLRKLKLNETIIQDPLSPLRKYAGKIQSVFTKPDEKTEVEIEKAEDELIPQRRSRKSFARRASFAMTGLSLSAMNASVLSESVCHEDRLNITKTVDLLSLLKTPSVNHRDRNGVLPGSRGLSMSSQSINAEMFEEAIHGPTQSIMKERDSSKPKVLKKVELRFENLSLQSEHSSEEEEENEKEITVYEDANDSLQRGRDSLPPSGDNILEESFNTPVKSSIAPGSANEQSSVFPLTVEATCMDTEMQTIDTPAVVQAEETDEAPVSSAVASPTNKSAAEKMEGTDSSMQTICEQSMSLMSTRSISRYAIEETQADLFAETFMSPPLPSPNKENPKFDSEPRTPEKASIPSSKSSSSVTPTKDDNDNKEEDMEIIVAGRSNIRQTRSSKSPTSVREKTGSNKSSRSTTPTRDLKDDYNELEDITENSNIRQTRSSQSRAPVRELPSTSTLTIAAQTPPEDGNKSDEEDVEKQCQRQTRSSKSRTPVREMPSTSSGGPVTAPTPPEEGGKSDEEGTEKQLRRNTRSSKSRTPVREISLTNTVPVAAPTPPEDGNRSEEDAEKHRKRKTRSSKSRTPVREMPSTSSVHVAAPTPPEEGSKSDEEDADKQLRRKTRSSKSRTPVRDIPTRKKSSPSISITPSKDDNKEEEDLDIVDKSNIRQTRSSKYSALVREKTGSNRSSRSTTPTRDLKGENKEVEDVIEKSSIRRTRSSQSRTPVREIPSTSTVPGTVPTPPEEEANNSDEEDAEKQLRRKTRSSKSRTPVRDIPLRKDSSPYTLPPANTSGAPRKKRARTPSRDIEEAVEEEEEAEEDEQIFLQKGSTSRKRKLEKPSRASQRQLKYFEHHQELSTVIEDTLLSSEDKSEFEATVVAPPTVTEKKPRRIKGIRAREPIVDETLVEVKSELSQSSKRFRSSASDLVAGLLTDDDDAPAPPVATKRPRRTKTSRVKAEPIVEVDETLVEEESEQPKATKRLRSSGMDLTDIYDEDDDAQSHVSSRSTRSTSSRKSVASNKGKSTRGRRGRGKSTTK